MLFDDFMCTVFLSISDTPINVKCLWKLDNLSTLLTKTSLFIAVLKYGNCQALHMNEWILSWNDTCIPKGQVYLYMFLTPSRYV